MTNYNYSPTLQGEKQDWIDWRAENPYKVLRDVYGATGGIGDPCAKSYLVANKSELFFRTRRSLTPYTPWFSLYIDAQYEPLYTEEPPVYPQDAPESVLSFVDDCNRGGMSLDDFKMNATANCLMDGVVFVGSGYDGDATKEPWLYYYTASQLNLKLTKTDRFGKVLIYVFTEQTTNDAGETAYIHDVYTLDEYAQYKSSRYDGYGDMISEQVPSLEIRAIYSQRKLQGEILPQPKNLPVAGLCIAVYNAESDQRWVLRVQGHAIFVIKSDIAPNGVNDGLSSVLHIDVADSAGGAEYVAPPAELSREHRESKDELVSQLFELMRHGGVIAQKTSQIPESGASKAYTFRPINTAISKCRKIAVEIDQYVIEVYKFYKGVDIAFEVRYKKDFTPTAGENMYELRVALDAFQSYKLTDSVRGVLRQMAIKAEAGEDGIAETDFADPNDIMMVVPNE